MPEYGVSTPRVTSVSRTPGTGRMPKLFRTCTCACPPPTSTRSCVIATCCCIATTLPKCSLLLQSPGGNMQIGFNLPISGPTSSPENLIRLAQEGEALGYDYLTVTDHV